MCDDPASEIDPPVGRADVATAARSRAGGFEPPAASLPVYREITPPHERVERFHDVELNVAIELGRVRMRRSDALNLDGGAVLELDKREDDPVDVWVKDKLIARGNVVVVNERLAVRIIEIIGNLREGRF